MRLKNRAFSKIILMISILLAGAICGGIAAAQPFYSKGDIDHSGTVDLKDAVLALKISSGAAGDQSDIYTDAEINEDKKIGPQEVIYILKRLSEALQDWHLVIGAPLENETIRPLLGVNCGPSPTGDPGNADLTAAYQQIGVTLIRNHGFNGPLDMSHMYPDRTKDPLNEAAYDFRESDKRFQDILNAGCEIYFRLGDGYSVVNPPLPSELDNWVQASVQVIRHYREGLWNGFNTPFRYLEIWNEPDYNQFWPAPLTMEDFFKLYTETANALKAAFPDLLIGGAGWTPKASMTEDGKEIVRQFVAYVKSAGAPLDFMSWHVYSNEPQDYADSAAFYRNLLDENGFADAESHITEWNTSLNGIPNDSQETQALRVNARGAALNTAFWIELQNAGAHVSAFFRGNDTSMDFTGFYGLYKADGTPKKVAYGFDLWSDMCQYPSKLALSATRNTDVSELRFLAGQNADGDTALLIANPNKEEMSYRLGYEGTAVSDSPADVTISEISDKISGVFRRSASSGVNTIGGETVQLLVIDSDPSQAGWEIEIKAPLENEKIRPLLGVNAGPYPAGEPGNKDLTAEYKQIRVNMVRTHDYYGPLDMAEMYPDRTADPQNPSSYNFTESDIRFQSVLDAGCEIYFRLGDSYHLVVPPKTEEMDNWVQAAVQVIRHYREGWADGFENDFRYLEIWNEPDNSHFWPPPFSYADFFRLYAETAKALKNAFPELLIGGPGWTPAGSLTDKGKQLSQDFADYVAEQGAPLDFMSWHVYSNDPNAYKESALFYRNLLDENGFADAQSHISEWNTQLIDIAQEDEALRMKAKGAALNTAFWIELQHANVDVSAFYRGNDTSVSFPAFYGLYQADGTPKKIAYAFDLWSDLCGFPQKIELSAKQNPDAPELYMLAGQNEAGDIALLIANPADKATVYRLEYGAVSASASFMMYEVNDYITGIYEYEGSETLNIIGGCTVQLLVISQ